MKAQVFNEIIQVYMLIFAGIIRFGTVKCSYNSWVRTQLY